MFPTKNGLKQGDLCCHCFSTLFYSTLLEGGVQVNQDGLKLNGIHQFLVYADNVNILGGSVCTMKKNTEALVAASMEIGLEVNAYETKYMVMTASVV
jgi:hypothetical protein